MTPEQFCYWLQGFGELATEPPTPEQWKAINEHLKAVFNKVTPPAPGDGVLRKVGPDFKIDDYWPRQAVPYMPPPGVLQC